MPPTSLLSTTPSVVNFAEIALPPGTTLSQFVSLQGSLVATAIAVAIAFGVLICDYIHLFPHEIQLYQTSKKGLWYNPTAWAFVLLRYSSILATFPALFLEFIQNKYCQAVVMSSQVGVVLVVASSGLIFGFRVSAMWGGHKAIYGVVGILYVIMLGCWCVVVFQYRTERAPPVPFGSNCHIRPFVTWAPIAYASSVAFDAVVLLLSAFKLITTHTSAPSPSSPPGEYAISSSSFMYILITTATNTALLVIQLLGPTFDHIKPTVAPIFTAITAFMAARVYLDLQLSSQQQIAIEFEAALTTTSMVDVRSGGVYPPPATPRRSTSSDAATPRGGGIPKAYEMEFFPLDVPRPDTPFGSYDYDTPKDTIHFQLPIFTRETVVTVE